jgi:hypothetical protein
MINLEEYSKAEKSHYSESITSPSEGPSNEEEEEEESEASEISNDHPTEESVETMEKESCQQQSSPLKKWMVEIRQGKKEHV